jgi:UDP-N-acetylmuramate dehydrogenase
LSGGFEHAVVLAPYTTLRLGGPADHFFLAETDASLIAAIRDAQSHGADERDGLFVLGGGSNIVVADEGFRGTVVRVATTGVTVEDGLVSAAAGVPWDEVVAQAVDAGLAGIECLSGIPGSTGATPIQNVGAYGQDVSQTVVMVDAYDRTTGVMALLDNADCAFGYRHSAFKADPSHYVVTRVHFRLSDNGGLSEPVRYKDVAQALGIEIGERAPLKDVREAVLEQRRRRAMVLDPEDHDTWSAGSFFTNPVLSAEQFAALERRCAPLTPPRFPEADGRVKTSAAWLIEQAGFGKGYSLGERVGLSTKHTLALTNRGGATTGELMRLAARVRDGVEERFGVAIVPEVTFVPRSELTF